ncbi:MAG: hypothetical protein JWL71_614 [Acidobacteria bacterium]|nr:hypothetical protein [Acidobacteriota bacterium]
MRSLSVVSGLVSLRVRQAIFTFVSLFVFVLITSTCSSPRPTASPAPAQQLWGDMKAVVSVKELMRDFIDPASDYVFDAIGLRISMKGEVATSPKTDADWEKLRQGGVMLAEGAYLLKVPRPFAPDGDVNNSTGPDPAELSPTQIQAKLEADPVLWNAKVEALRNVGLEVLEIVKRKDANELWDAAGNLDQACESCHVAYWYPGEGALMKRLDQKLEDLYGAKGDRTKTPGADPK